MGSDQLPRLVAFAWGSVIVPMLMIELSQWYEERLARCGPARAGGAGRLIPIQGDKLTFATISLILGLGGASIATSLIERNPSTPVLTQTLIAFVVCTFLLFVQSAVICMLKKRPFSVRTRNQWVYFVNLIGLSCWGVVVFVLFLRHFDGTGILP